MKRLAMCKNCNHNTPNRTPFCDICEGGDMFEMRKQRIHYNEYANGYRASLYIYDELCSGAMQRMPSIVKVIFNDPATIVMWNDGSKTVVKANNEVFDSEKGLAMAISKRVFGNKGNYFNEFKKWIPEEKTVVDSDTPKKEDDNHWYIWLTYCDLDGNETAGGVHPVPYAHKGSATRRAKKLWGDNPQVKWIVSRTNPRTEE